MKFEFTPEEEWDAPSPLAPDPVRDSALDSVGESVPGSVRESIPDPRHSSVRIAMAVERLHTRAHFDFARLHTSLNRMLYSVEPGRLQPDLSFEDSNPEPGVDLFRPEAFGARTLEGSRG